LQDAAVPVAIELVVTFAAADCGRPSAAASVKNPGPGLIKINARNRPANEIIKK